MNDNRVGLPYCVQTRCEDCEINPGRCEECAYFIQKMILMDKYKKKLPEDEQCNT